MDDPRICSQLYHFLVYPCPLQHAVIYRGRRDRSLGPEERLSFRSELSRQELDVLLPKFVGLPLLINHQGNDVGDARTFHGNQREPGGVVVDVYWHPEGLVNVVRLYTNETGRMVAACIASGNMMCVSLYHVSIGERYQLREISLCLQGKRPGARLLDICEAPFVQLPCPGPYIERSFTDDLTDLSYLGERLDCFDVQASSDAKDLWQDLWQDMDEQLFRDYCQSENEHAQLQHWRQAYTDAETSQRRPIIQKASAYIRCYHKSIRPKMPQVRFLNYLWV